MTTRQREIDALLEDYYAREQTGARLDAGVPGWREGVREYLKARSKLR